MCAKYFSYNAHDSLYFSFFPLRLWPFVMNAESLVRLVVREFIESTSCVYCKSFILDEKNFLTPFFISGCVRAKREEYKYSQFVDLLLSHSDLLENRASDGEF